MLCHPVREMHGDIGLLEYGIHRIVHEYVAMQWPIRILDNRVQAGLIADAESEGIEAGMEDMLGELVRAIMFSPEVGIKIFEYVIGVHHGLACRMTDDFSLALPYRRIPRYEYEDPTVALVDVGPCRLRDLFQFPINVCHKTLQ